MSGAGGRVEKGGFPFLNIYENYRAYKIFSHQHEAEIDYYSKFDIKEKFDFPINFTPHLLPINRGILSTISIHWKKNPNIDLINFYKEKAELEKFIRFYKTPEEVEISKIVNTNFLDFGLRTRNDFTIIVSAIDNLVKGAAGQAIQNMNLMLGYNESCGLL